jgi:hypothetical protein
VALGLSGTVVRAEGDTIRASMAKVDFSTMQPANPSIKAPVAAQASEGAVPRSLPRQAKVHKSTSAIVMSSVSIVAGLAGTYYAMKMMKDAQKKTEQP